MPSTLTFPGVYIEELSSGVHTITGVATSITAFVGRAERGPVNTPTTVTSLADFVRVFGRPDTRLGLAVQDFYLNGGTQAIVVRVFKKGTGERAALLTPGGLPLRAASDGSWANNLVVRVELPTANPTKEPDEVVNSAATRLKVKPADLFHLTVIEAVSSEAADDIVADPKKNLKPANVVSVETIRYLTVVESTRRFDRALAAESNLVRSNVPEPFVAPAMPIAGIERPEKNADDGGEPTPADLVPDDGGKTGMRALEDADLFNLLCVPDLDATGDGAAAADIAAAYCEQHRAMLLLDPPTAWKDVPTAVAAMSTGAGVGTNSKNAAVFFPRYRRPNRPDLFPVCGAVAGVFARTDAERGVWKAPAGTDATLRGVPQLAVHLTDAENGLLNPLGVNCLREFPATGRVVWGSRTLQGDDRQASEWKYIPVRRTALFIEESLFRGTKWVVFEPNDEPLWAQIRLNIGAFMNNLFRQGAFQGMTPREAYFVKCDKETTTQNDIDRGVVNIIVGFAPLKPAEFVIISIQQIAGQLQV